MQGEKKERWMELCAQAAVEHDPQKLHVLIEEIDILLQQKEDRLKASSRPPQSTDTQFSPNNS